MNKKILFVLIAFSHLTFGYSQYDYKKQGKAVVQVWVEIPGSDPNVCTGFVWKQNDWVVTSLHALHPNGNVKILYGDYWNENVEVIRVHEKADLVLLKVSDPAIFPPEVVPILSAYTNTIAHDEGLSSIGYNMGARSAQPKSLTRGGSMKKETLKNTLPPDVVEKLEAYRVPDVDIEIMMLEGSLLPGYSGSPIFYKKDGSLVAIGDGGLDAGTKNVSWGIPAKYLEELENSPLVTKVPYGIESSPLHYSSAVKVKNKATAEKINESNEEMNFEEYFDLLSEEYAGIRFGDYEFFYVKTRTYEELYSTSFDVGNLDTLMMEFRSYGLNLDYDLFEFDIYEDPYNEVIIVVPADMPLIVDNSGNFYSDLSYLPMGNYFSLNFGVDYSYYTDVTSAATGLNNLINSSEIGIQLNGFTKSEEDFYGYELDEYSQIAWMILTSNSLYEKKVLDPYGNEVVENDILLLYYTVMYNNYVQPTTFYSMAGLSMPDYSFSYLQPGNYLNCIDPNSYAQNQNLCDYFESWMKVVIASHFTSFSYIQYAEN